MPKPKEKGLALIASYLLLSVFLIYTNALTMRVMTEQHAVDQLQDRLQALDLAQGALEQMRLDFYAFLTEDVYQLRYQGDALATMHWLDDLTDSTKQTSLDPPFALFEASGFVEGTAPLSESAPRSVSLITGSGQAWIRSVVVTEPGNSLSPRWVTIEAKATVGSVTQRIQATYQFALGMSDIFRYAYFLNNYGWLQGTRDTWIDVFGEARSNGDMSIIQDTSVGAPYGRIYFLGDLYASENPALINPNTGLPVEGLISGDPSDYGSMQDYYDWRAPQARPARRLTFSGQPAIGGVPKILPEGYGWDSDNPNQRRFERQAIQPIPYLGDLSYYKKIATERSTTLRYYDSALGSIQTISGTYAGPDGVSGTGDDRNPLVLIGTPSNPIVLNGPVVIPGDVVIKGTVKGRGVIYSGRNIHIVGQVQYEDPPSWPALERNVGTGQIREYGQTGGPRSNLGTVCTDGTYVAPGGSVPAGCI